MRSNNLINRLCHLTFRRNYFHVSYLFIYCENHPQSTLVKKKRLRNTLVNINAYCACRKVTLYFSAAIVAKVESLVTDIVTDVLIHFPVVAQRSKGAHYFHRVVGLVVINIRQWLDTQCDVLPLST